MTSRAVAPRKPDETRFELTLGRWLALCAVGLGILILTALLRGTPEDISWYLAHVLPGVAVVVFCTTRIGRPVATYALLGYAVLLPMLTLLSGFGLLDPWNDGVRIQLFTDNPNLLGADLVAVTLAAMVVQPRLPWAAWLPVVAMAVVFTGSRTALLALCLAAAASLILPSIGYRARVATLVGVGAFMILLAVASLQVQHEATHPNLLHVSHTFNHYRWQNFGHARVNAEPRGSSGPLPGTTAERIRSPSNDHTLVLIQFIGPAQEGMPYVASVYLRADHPQEVVLSTVFSRTTCVVEAVWQRCATPPGFGDAQHNMQLRLEKAAPSETLDVYAFGPQYERGVEPSVYAIRGRSLIPPPLLLRFGLHDMRDWTDIGRFAAIEAYLMQVLDAPWFGSGSNLEFWQSAEAVAQEPVHSMNHAHNLIAERLARDGVLGLVAWSLILGPLLFARLLVDARLAVPWFVGLVVLNSFDMTVFHSGSYFSGTIVLALALQRVTQTQHPPWPQRAHSGRP